MASGDTQHVLDPLFAWAIDKYAEATEQPGFHGDLAMRVAIANGKITIIERTISETYKPAKN